jgi:hypothetical protein
MKAKEFKMREKIMFEYYRASHASEVITSKDQLAERVEERIRELENDNPTFVERYSLPHREHLFQLLRESVNDRFKELTKEEESQRTKERIWCPKSRGIPQTTLFAGKKKSIQSANDPASIQKATMEFALDLDSCHESGVYYRGEYAGLRSDKKIPLLSDMDVNFIGLGRSTKGNILPQVDFCGKKMVYACYEDGSQWSKDRGSQRNFVFDNYIKKAFDPNNPNKYISTAAHHLEYCGIIIFVQFDVHQTVHHIGGFDAWCMNGKGEILNEQ